MPRQPTVDSPLQFRKPLPQPRAGALRRNDNINHNRSTIYFQIHREAKRMARTFRRIVIRLVLTLASAAPVYAQNHARSARAFGQAPTQTASSPSAPASGTDISQISSDALNWLQDLIRINTTNPPGNELVAAKYIANL